MTWTALNSSASFRLLRASQAVFKENVAISTYQPRVIWSQIRERRFLLALDLGRVYCGPGLSAGVER